MAEINMPRRAGRRKQEFTLIDFTIELVDCGGYTSTWVDRRNGVFELPWIRTNTHNEKLNSIFTKLLQAYDEYKNRDVHDENWKESESKGRFRNALTQAGVHRITSINDKSGRCQFQITNADKLKRLRIGGSEGNSSPESSNASSEMGPQSVGSTEGYDHSPSSYYDQSGTDDESQYSDIGTVSENQPGYPHYQQGQPHNQQSHPHYQQGQPHYQQSHPHYQQSHPHYQQSHPHYQQAQPHYQQSHPHYQQSQKHYQQRYSEHQQRYSVHQPGPSCYQPRVVQFRDPVLASTSSTPSPGLATWDWPQEEQGSQGNTTTEVAPLQDLGAQGVDDFFEDYCVQELMDFLADQGIKNTDGDTAMDIGIDANDDVVRHVFSIAAVERPRFYAHDFTDSTAEGGSGQALSSYEDDEVQYLVPESSSGRTTPKLFAVEVKLYLMGREVSVEHMGMDYPSCIYIHGITAKPTLRSQLIGTSRTMMLLTRPHSKFKKVIAMLGSMAIKLTNEGNVQINKTGFTKVHIMRGGNEQTTITRNKWSPLFNILCSSQQSVKVSVGVAFNAANSKVPIVLEVTSKLEEGVPAKIVKLVESNQKNFDLISSEDDKKELENFIDEEGLGLLEDREFNEGMYTKFSNVWNRSLLRGEVHPSVPEWSKDIEDPIDSSPLFSDDEDEDYDDGGGAVTSHHIVKMEPAERGGDTPVARVGIHIMGMQDRTPLCIGCDYPTHLYYHAAGRNIPFSTANVRVVLLDCDEWRGRCTRRQLVALKAYIYLLGTLVIRVNEYGNVEVKKTGFTKVCYRAQSKHYYNIDRNKWVTLINMANPCHSVKISVGVPFLMGRKRISPPIEIEVKLEPRFGGSSTVDELASNFVKQLKV